jgi:hypothetical protein
MKVSPIISRVIWLTTHAPQFCAVVTPLANEVLVEVKGSLQLPPDSHSKHNREVTTGIRALKKEYNRILISSNLPKRRAALIIVVFIDVSYLKIMWETVLNEVTNNFFFNRLHQFFILSFFLFVSLVQNSKIRFDSKNNFLFFNFLRTYSSI